MKKLALVLALTLFASAAIAEIPDWESSIVEFGPTGASLFNLPDGTGSLFTEAQIADGSVVNGTVTLYVRNVYNGPIAGYPAEDLWLEASDGGLVPCANGAIADGPTDANGVAVWVEAMNAGGFSMADAYVMIAGQAVLHTPLDLHFNSADMNGDGTVNLADVGAFSGIFFGAYDFSADFFRDGVLNLADVGRLAGGLGGSCGN